jgi:hypothetical protein
MVEVRLLPPSDELDDSRARLEARASALLTGLDERTQEVSLDILKRFGTPLIYLTSATSLLEHVRKFASNLPKFAHDRERQSQDRLFLNRRHAH